MVHMFYFFIGLYLHNAFGFILFGPPYAVKEDAISYIL